MTAWREVRDKTGLIGHVVMETDRGVYVSFDWLDREEMRFIPHGRYYVGRDGWQPGDSAVSMALLVNGRRVVFDPEDAVSALGESFNAAFEAGLRETWRAVVIPGTLYGTLGGSGKWSGTFRAGDVAYRIVDEESDGIEWHGGDGEPETPRPTDPNEDFDEIIIDPNDLPPSIEPGEAEAAEEARLRFIESNWEKTIRELLDYLPVDRAVRWYVKRREELAAVPIDKIDGYYRLVARQVERFKAELDARINQAAEEEGA